MIAAPMASVEIITKNVDDLPPDWEVMFSGSALYGKSFLKLVHNNVINSNQLYYYKSSAEGTDCGIVSCVRMRATRWMPPMKTFLCRFPLSLPTRGYALTSCSVKVAEEIIEKAGTGLKVIIIDQNTPHSPLEGWTEKSGMPYAVFHNRYNTFDEYISSLKINYRKSIRRSMRKFKGVVVREENKDDFSAEHYLLYRYVARRAKYRGFEMGGKFFTGMNIGHAYISAYAEGELIGWVLLLYDGDIIYAPICGFKAKANAKYDVWRNLHLEAIRKAIDSRYSRVEFGDTAEVGKIKLGCVLESRSLLAKHDNTLLNMLLVRTRWLEYRMPGVAYHPYGR